MRVLNKKLFYYVSFFLIVILLSYHLAPTQYREFIQNGLYRLINPKKKCYASCFVNQEVLKAKLRSGLPVWARTQIKEDLKKNSKISKVDLDAYFIKNNTPENQLIRFTIKNRKLKVQASEYVRLKQALLYMVDVFDFLVENDYLPDTDFILSLEDYLQAKKTVIPIFVFAKDEANPLEKDLILFPDWMNIAHAFDFKTNLPQAIEKNPWSQKIKKIIWRGSKQDSTGFRKKVADFSKQHPTILDAEFSMNQTILDKNSKFLSKTQQLQYRYLLSIDGARCTWDRLVWQLSSNSLVLKHQSTQKQWFYKGIQPYVHYIPIHTELDLLQDFEKYNIQNIIKNANAFSENNLKIEDFYHYIIELLRQYTNLNNL